MVKTRIFAIGNSWPRIWVGSRANPRQNGFTLVELLVVLAIGALLVGLAPPAFDRLREGSQYRDAVRAIVVDLRQARQQALTYGRVVVFRIDLSDRKYGIEGAPFKDLPESLEIQATVGRTDDSSSPANPAISFMPQGGSTGGTIELIRKAGTGVIIRVDWLFGQITQHPRAS